MPGRDDDIIDEAVVRVGPDLTGFRRKLERELKTQLAGVNLEVPVKINESKQREALNYVAGLRAKHIKEQLSRTRNAAEKVGQAEDQARQHELKQVRSFQESKTRLQIQAQEQELKRVRSTSEKIQQARDQAIKGDKSLDLKRDVDRQRKDEQYLTFQQKVNSELAKMAQARADDEISIRHDTQTRVAQVEREGSRLRIAVLAAEERVEREHLARTEKAEKESIARRNKANADRKKTFDSLTTSPQFIDYGGRGIKPMNALYGVVTAMTPALFAMGASAVQASTSIAALGSAGIGAAAGLSGVMIAFQGIGDLLSLRKQVLNEQTTGAANAARDAVRSADDLAQAKRTLADAQRDEASAEKDLHKARRESIRDLEDLKQAVIDLDNQYKSDTLSVAEARETAVATDRNFFASALDRARAWQDVRDAETQLKDTTLQRKQKKQDLKESLAGGIEQSDRMKQARERVRDARDRRLDAQAALRKQSSSTAAGIDKVSSASAQLKKKLAELSPAARQMYDWFEKNEGLFKRLQNQIAQQVLPGFTKFLKAITSAPKGGKSTLQLAAEYAGELGAIISKYAGLFGEWTKSPLFRSSMARIQERNARAFDNLGQALLTLADPITRILDKASPGFEALSEVLLDLAESFDKWIEELDKSGGLEKWFKDARTELGKWWDILVNVGELFKNIFTAALPSGSSLVTSFRDFTQSLVDWSNSPDGKESLKDFFEGFRDLPYAKIADFFKNAATFFVAFRTFALLKSLNPFMLALGALAAANPEKAAQAFATIADKLAWVMEQIVAHPEAAAALLGIFAAAKLGKAVGFDIKIPVINKLRDALVSRFKVLDKFVGGGATTGTMNVQAAVVNVYGKGGVDLDPTGKSKKGGKTPPIAGGGVGLGSGITAAAVLGAIFGTQQFNRAGKGEGFLQPFADFTKDPSWATFGNSMQMFSPVGWLTYGLGQPSVKKFLSESVPNALTGKTGGWPTVATYMLNIAKLSIGAPFIQGLWAGIKETWDSIWKTVKGWVNDGFAKPLIGLFSAAGTAVAAGFANGFGSLITKLASPALAVLQWIDKNFISKINGLLTALGATAIPTLVGGSAKDAGKGVGKIIGDIAAKLADGGRVPGHSPHPKADNIPAMLTANEYVQPVAAVKHYGTDFMDAVRTRRFPRYAQGGLVGTLTGTFGKNLFTQIAGAAITKLGGSVAAAAARLATGPDSGSDQEYTGRTPRGLGAVGGLGNRMMAAVVATHRLFPWASVTSGYRPGSITVTGNKSYHGKRRATDWPASMELFNHFVAQYGKFAKEIIYSPAGNRQIWNGRPHMYTGAVRNTHWNHVHLALANGGLVPARKYDSGGVLPPGYTTVYNGTGRNETVRTDKQEKALAATRLDRRDLVLLAQYMANAVGSPTIAMDGRRVAETTNRYNYLPAGV